MYDARITEPIGHIVKPSKEKESYVTIDLAIYKHKRQRKLKESEKRFAATIRCIGDAVIATDKNGLITFMNPVAEGLTGWKLEEALNQRLAEVFSIIDRDTREPVGNPVITAIREGAMAGPANHTRLMARDGTEIPIDGTAAPIKDENGGIIGVVMIFRDVTKRERREAQREKLIHELREALAKSKVLHGILPICASCKKIRDDRGDWNRIESYIEDHSEVAFSHGICPECIIKLYPDFSHDAL